MDGDVIYGIAEEKVGMDVHIKFGNARSNISSVMQLARIMMNEHLITEPVA